MQGIQKYFFRHIPQSAEHCAPRHVQAVCKETIGWTANGPWYLVSCAICGCPRAACIWTFSKTTFQIRGSHVHCCVPIGPWVLTSRALGPGPLREMCMGSIFTCPGIGVLDSLASGCMCRSAKRRELVWRNLHAYVSPGPAPVKGAKLCTYHHWFGRSSSPRFEPYYELPISSIKVRALGWSRLGCHALAIWINIEQGHIARPALPRHLQLCTVRCGR